MSEAVLARLSALNRAHGLARSGATERVSLEELLRSLLEPYTNCEIAGPPAYLVERALAPLVMTFHELATNALKYGALSVAHGHVEISWMVDEAHVDLIWRERNGPRPEFPTPHGFGSALIRSSVASLKGTISKAWPETGLVAHLRLPSDVLTL